MPAFTTIVALGPDLDEIADADATMPAAGQTTEAASRFAAEANLGIEWVECSGEGRTDMRSDWPTICNNCN